MTIVELGTFSAAASSLGYSQSTISQQIRSLERDVGGPVFERFGGANRVRLSPLGEVLLGHAARVLGELDQTRRAVADYHDGRGTITIGTFQAVTSVILPLLVSALLNRDPTIRIVLVEQEAPTPVLDDVDISFFDAPPAPDDHGMLIAEDDHVLLAPAGRLPTGPVDLTQLEDQPFVALPSLCDQARVEDALHIAGHHPHVIFRTSDNAGLQAMVGAGLGYAILPTLSITPRDDVVVHSLAAPIQPRQIYLQWRRPPTPLAQRAITLTANLTSDLQTRTQPGHDVP